MSSTWYFPLKQDRGTRKKTICGEGSLSWKNTAKKTHWKLVDVISQTGSRKTSSVTLNKAESKPKLAELRGAVAEQSAGTYYLMGTE